MCRGVSTCRRARVVVDITLKNLDEDSDEESHSNSSFVSNPSHHRPVDLERS